MGGLIDEVFNTDISGKKARKDAYAAQSAATDSANALQERMYNQTRQDVSPYRRAGSNAIDRIEGLPTGYSDVLAEFDKRRNNQDRLDEIKRVKAGQSYWTDQLNRIDSGNATFLANKKYHDDRLNELNAELVAIDAEEKAYKEKNPALSADKIGQNIMSQDPGYQFRLAEGNKALEAAASARGAYGGGATMKSLARYGQDYASNEYGNAYNRLSSLAGMGASASASLATNNMNYANNVGNNMTSLANSYGAMRVGDSESQRDDLNLAVRAGTAAATSGASEGMGSSGKMSQLGKNKIPRNDQFDSWSPESTYNMSSFGRIPRA